MFCVSQLLQFGNFIREGACTDLPNQKDIMKLMRYESSKGKEGEVVSLAEYIERNPDTQGQIYYMVTASRKQAESSPCVLLRWVPRSSSSHTLVMLRVLPSPFVSERVRLTRIVPTFHV